MYSGQPYKRCFRRASGLGWTSCNFSQLPTCQVIRVRAAYLSELWVKRKHWMGRWLPLLFSHSWAQRRLLLTSGIFLWMWLLTDVWLVSLLGHSQLAAAGPHFSGFAYSSQQNLDSLSRAESIMGVSSLHFRAAAQRTFSPAIPVHSPSPNPPRNRPALL